MAFPATASFSTAAVFPHIPPFVTNAQKLSLPANTPVGTRVQVTDGFVVSGLTDDAVNGNGFFAPVGVYNGKTSYVNTRIAGSTVANTGVSIFWNGSLWSIDDESGLGGICTSIEDVAEPWLVTSWSIAGGVTTSAPTLTHPAVQQLAASSTEQGAVFVLGGTYYDGIYKRYGENFLDAGRPWYDILGSGSGGTPTEDYGCYWNGTDRWKILDDESALLYYSLSDVATPDLATNWKNASDDSPASITVTSVTHGELNAGMILNNVFYQVNSNTNGRNRFSDVLGVQPSIYFNGTVWTDGTTTSDDETLAFIWNGSGDLAGDRTNVCSEANWINI